MRGIKLLAAAMTSTVLVACGGGGDVAGDTSGFAVFPNETTYTPVLGSTTVGTETVVNACGSESATGSGQYVINGGVPPFRLVSSQPGLVSLSATTLSGKDPMFTATYSGTKCSSTTTVTIIDFHSRTVVLTINVDPEEPDV